MHIICMLFFLFPFSESITTTNGTIDKTLTGDSNTLAAPMTSVKTTTMKSGTTSEIITPAASPTAACPGTPTATYPATVEAATTTNFHVGAELGSGLCSGLLAPGVDEAVNGLGGGGGGSGVSLSLSHQGQGVSLIDVTFDSAEVEENCRAEDKTCYENDTKDDSKSDDNMKDTAGDMSNAADAATESKVNEQSVKVSSQAVSGESENDISDHSSNPVSSTTANKENGDGTKKKADALVDKVFNQTDEEKLTNSNLALSDDDKLKTKSSEVDSCKAMSLSKVSSEGKEHQSEKKELSKNNPEVSSEKLDLMFESSTECKSDCQSTTSKLQLANSMSTIQPESSHNSASLQKSPNPNDQSQLENPQITQTGNSGEQLQQQQLDKGCSELETDNDMDNITSLSVEWDINQLRGGGLEVQNDAEADLPSDLVQRLSTEEREARRLEGELTETSLPMDFGDCLPPRLTALVNKQFR